MSNKKPLILGPDGYPANLQSGDWINGSPDFELDAGVALGSGIVGFPIGKNLVNLWNNASGSGLTSATSRWQAVYLPVAQTITGFAFRMITQGVYTASNENRGGLFTWSAGTMTSVASSTNNGNLWKAAVANIVKEPFTTTYAAAAGLYFVNILYNSSAQTTAPSIGIGTAYPAGSNTNDYTNNGCLAYQLGSATTLPSTQAASGLTKVLVSHGIFLYV